LASADFSAFDKPPRTSRTPLVLMPPPPGSPPDPPLVLVSVPTAPSPPPPPPVPLLPRTLPAATLPAMAPPPLALPPAGGLPPAVTLLLAALPQPAPSHACEHCRCRHSRGGGGGGDWLGLRGSRLRRLGAIRTVLRRGARLLVLLHGVLELRGGASAHATAAGLLRP